MSIYKPSLLDKFKDFVNGVKANWDEYEDHVADFESHRADYENLIDNKVIGDSTLEDSRGYTRFMNGMQVAWGTLSIEISNSGTQSSSRVFEFTKRFQGSPKVFGNLVGGSVSNSGIDVKFITFSAESSSEGRVSISVDSPRAQTYHFSYFAIGRWK